MERKEFLEIYKNYMIDYGKCLAKYGEKNATKAYFEWQEHVKPMIMCHDIKRYPEGYPCYPDGYTLKFDKWGNAEHIVHLKYYHEYVNIRPAKIPNGKGITEVEIPQASWAIHTTDFNSISLIGENK